MTPTDQWISKTEAGLRLGLSGRRIHDLANTGRLQSCQVRDPDTGHMAIRIHAGSVERFIFERDNEESPKISHNLPQSPTSNLPQSPTSRGSGGAHDTQDLIDQWIMRIMRPALSAPSARLWLTIPESAAYSGLPAAVIMDFIGKGKLAAMDVGRRRGGRWRIRRMDLESFSG